MAKKEPPHIEHVDLIDRILTNLQTDFEAQDEQKILINNARSFLTEIEGRIKQAINSLGFLQEFMTDEQLEKLEEMNFSISPETRSGGNLNEAAQLAWDILQATENGEMTREDLHQAYQKAAGEGALNYSLFNVKIRSLFSSSRLIERVPQDASNTRSHIVRINGFQAKN